MTEKNVIFMKFNKIISFVCFLCFMTIGMTAQAQTHWSFTTHQYDMTIYAKLTDGGTDVTSSDNYEVGAFIDGECCGIASLTTGTDNNSNPIEYLYLRVYDEDGNGNITIKVWDKAKGAERVVTAPAAAISFASNKQEGLPSKPITISLELTYAITATSASETMGTAVLSPSSHFVAGTEVTATATANTGYEFVNWTVENEEVSADAEYTFSATTDAALVANFKAKSYTITYVKDNDQSDDVRTYDFGASVNTPSAPTKAGYTFAGWNNEIPSTMPAENLTFTATWEPAKYTLTFDSDGGSDITPITVAYNEDITAPANPTRSGFTFAGWEPALPTTMDAAAIETLKSCDNTFTAQWEAASTVRIQFVADGVAFFNKELSIGSELTAPTAPAKEGYKFIGWDKVVPATVPDEDAIYTAVYVLVGDVNEDNTVNILDVLATLSIMKGDVGTFNQTAADANDDGSVNILDVLKILEIMKQQ